VGLRAERRARAGINHPDHSVAAGTLVKLPDKIHGYAAARA
jgi:hypothetical protein